jgi:hypothetical protein
MKLFKEAASYESLGTSGLHAQQTKITDHIMAFGTLFYDVFAVTILCSVDDRVTSE